MTWIKYEDLKDKGHFVYCDNCKGLIAHINAGAIAYDLFYVCRCNLRGDVSPAGKEVEKIKSYDTSPGARLYISDNSYICSSCGRMLFELYNKNLNTFCFDIVCPCGRRYSSAQKHDSGEQLSDCQKRLKGKKHSKI